MYQAITKEITLINLDKLDDKWGKKYPAAIRSWRNNWTDISTYFKYPSEIRKIIYTTNTIENFNRGLRRTTKFKAAWISEDALLKAL